VLHVTKGRKADITVAGDLGLSSGSIYSLTTATSTSLLHRIEASRAFFVTREAQVELRCHGAL
jgi:predicted cupin superfamily sugar epimerase